MGRPNELNDSGTVGEPSVNGSTNTGPVQTSPSNRGDKSRIGTDAFLQSMGLNPADGWKTVGLPTQKLDKDNTPIPGQYTIQVSGPKGETRTVTMTPQSGSDVTSTPLDQVDWTVTGVDQTVAPNTGKTGPETDAAIAASQAQVEQAHAAAAKSAADLATVQNENAQRAANAQKNGLYLTDKERADMEAQLRSSNLQQAQIDAQLKIASDNAKNSATSNEIAAQNAATNAKVAEHNAIIDDARVQLGKDQLNLDQAKQIFTEEQAKITNAQADGKLALDQLTQRQANEVAQQQVENSRQANTLRGTEGIETQRHNQATEAQAQQTAQQQAQQNALTTTADIYKTTQTNQAQNAQTGAGLLQNRVTAATGALGNIMGTLGQSKMLQAPANFGENITNGLQEWITGLGGGQPVYDSAAAMVNAANPAISQNQDLASQAYTALRGMLDLYKAQTGQPHPLEVEQARAGAAAGGLPVTAPVTAGAGAGGVVTPPSAPAPTQAVTAPATAVPPNTWAGWQAQAQPAVGQPANPALVVGGNTGAPWGVPGVQPIPSIPVSAVRPIQPFMAPQTVAA